ncbi:two-component system, chemotaxis family, response regulator CheB [Sphingomonas gellani]|uniref:Protein-glutamate methylesterase/protein-glutamine glutaminase n=1 Tax=Sphingomonas gellani TaxID=1166340 RepID=A0A1H8DR06_9SPHN|nr:chemotaxis response regulator protein-glutamate methylesterase [Sphingomonas gellani]SEN09605.1 two-component system, chemotaxis family, response regulator CheB [Sphingomonas gellani]
MTVRTLIVDDSASMRALIARTLSNDPAIEVVGAAEDPFQAREMIKTLDPDVITLDVEMPGMNGLDFLDRIMRLRPMPVVMLSTLTQAGAAATIEALEIGAFDCCAKPAHGQLDPALVETVKAAGTSRRRQPRRTANSPTGTPPADYTPRPDTLIALGASTGGVEALIELLSGFPANCPPTVVVQHMPGTFTGSFAARLDRLTPPHVSEARSGERLQAGHVYLAPGGTHHLEVRGSNHWYCRLVPDDPVSGHRPSVDRLFASVAQTCGSKAVGAILTGMGRDGATGLKAMRNAGSFTVGQDQATSTVYGMPCVAFEIGAVEQQLPLSRIARPLLDRCRA